MLVLISGRTLSDEVSSSCPKDVECELKLTEILSWRYQKQKVNGTRNEGSRGGWEDFNWERSALKMVVALQPSKGVEMETLEMRRPQIVFYKYVL